MSKRAATTTFQLPLTKFVTATSPNKRARLASTAVNASVTETRATGNDATDVEKESAAAAAAAAPPPAPAGLPTFSLQSYKASLSSSPRPGSGLCEQQLLALECATLDSSWLQLLQHELRRDYFLKLKEQLWKEGVREGGDSAYGRVFPPARDIYAWSRCTPLHKVKVVIIGQDPYHDAGQAHGLCFSVRPGVKVPPSLRNIYKELATEYPGFVPPKHGNLTSLARSGVLLLNTSLTVRAHQAGSHTKLGWETFTDKLVQLVDQYGGSDGHGLEGRGVVVLAWGAWAAKRVAKLDRTKHLVLESAHPSPLSASRGFFNNRHFTRANAWLEKKYGPGAGIDWTTLDERAGMEEEEEQEQDRIGEKEGAAGVDAQDLLTTRIEQAVKRQESADVARTAAQATKKKK